MSSSGVLLVEPVGPQVTRTVDPFTSHRRESWRVDLLDLNDAPIGTLDGVEGGSFDFSIHDTIRTGGSLTVAGQTVDWHRVRVQPWYVIQTPDGPQEWPMGVFIPATPTTQHTDTGHAVNVELYDKLLILDQTKAWGTYSIEAGAVVTEVVRGIIGSVGETRRAITDSPETLSAAMVWEAGTSMLRIVNDLLAAINYFSVWVDGYGVFRADPYVRPADRGAAWAFVDDARSIYSPDFSHEADGFNVPNVVILVGQSDGDTPALTAQAVNEDPLSPWSIPTRGREIAHVETGVEATSQVVLDNLAARRLIELSDVASTYEIAHAWVPLDLNDAVILRRQGVVDTRCVVQKQSVSMETGGLVRSTLREVAA